MELHQKMAFACVIFCKSVIRQLSFGCINHLFSILTPAFTLSCLGLIHCFEKPVITKEGSCFVH